MRPGSILRTTITFALALALVAETAGGGALAQPAADTAGLSDPPARVGRMARLLGTVSFRGVEQPEWQAAAMNYPVTSGNSFWTEPSSAAEVDIGPARLALDQSTQFDIETLDDHALQATQAQGATFLRVRAMEAGDIYRITTPRGAVVITQPGAYGIIAGDRDHPTFVTVVEGAARIDSTSASLTLGPRQTGRIEGEDRFAVSVGPAIMDPFVTARLAQERALVRPVAARMAPPPIVGQMTGGDALARDGNWASSPTYGQIWYPPVQASWVPYRDGHWGYVAPWGWTWIDDAPWGFAPFHYGRWVQDGRRWGWIPAERSTPGRLRAPPVYAPALVSFISIGIGGAIAPGNDRGRNPGGPDGRGSVGWVPLGAREAYVPPYRASERYVRAVNVGNVTNVTNINTVTNVTTINNLANRNAVTVVPAAAMTTSRPIRAQAQQVDQRALAGARRERAAPVQPTTGTLGVTPAVARRLELRGPATAVVRAGPAPGPVAPAAVVPAVVVQSPAPAATPAEPGSRRPGGGRPERQAPALPAAVSLPVLRQAPPDAPPHPQAVAPSVPVAPALTPPPAGRVPAPPAVLPREAVPVPPITMPGRPAAPAPPPPPLVAVPAPPVAVPVVPARPLPADRPAGAVVAPPAASAPPLGAAPAPVQPFVAPAAPAEVVAPPAPPRVAPGAAPAVVAPLAPVPPPIAAPRAERPQPPDAAGGPPGRGGGSRPERGPEQPAPVAPPKPQG